MRRDAEAHAAEDTAQRELVDLKNRAENIVYQTRKHLNEYGDKVASDVRGQIESALSSVESRLKEDDKTAIEASLKELERVSMELGKAVYESQAKAGPTGGAGPGGSESSGASSKSDDVIDAEYEVKDDNN